MSLQEPPPHLLRAVLGFQSLAPSGSAPRRISGHQASCRWSRTGLWKLNWRVPSPATALQVSCSSGPFRQMSTVELVPDLRAPLGLPFV
jgi:hypothetical protein